MIYFFSCFKSVIISDTKLFVGNFYFYLWLAFSISAAPKTTPL